MKKSVFTYLNYVLPQAETSCRCTARPTRARTGDTAIFFGLSGTGKTTLSADPHRILIGDDEHGWGRDGVFNFEGGCYAKAIRLSREAEPEIYATTERFGTVMENVALDPDCASPISTTIARPKTPASPIPCISSPTPRRPGARATRRTSSC